jgi:hypothetical protein
MIGLRAQMIVRMYLLQWRSGIFILVGACEQSLFSILRWQDESLKIACTCVMVVGINEFCFATSTLEAWGAS